MTISSLTTREKTFRVLFFIAFIAVSVLSLIPDPDDVPGGMDITRWLAEFLLGDEAYADKISHFIAYGVLGGGVALGTVRLFGSMLVAAAAVMAWSGVLEFFQGLTSYRSNDFLDLMANVSGVTIGFITGLLLIKIADIIASPKRGVA